MGDNIEPGDEEVTIIGSVADGDEIPASEEDITQDEAPINPEEEAAADSAEEEVED